MENIQIVGIVLFALLIISMIYSIGKRDREEDLGKEELKDSFLVVSAEIYDDSIEYELEDSKKRRYAVELYEPYTVGTRVPLELVIFSSHQYTTHWGLNKKYKLDENGEKIIFTDVYEKDSELEDEE